MRTLCVILCLFVSNSISFVSFSVFGPYFRTTLHTPWSYHFRLFCAIFRHFGVILCHFHSFHVNYPTFIPFLTLSFQTIKCLLIVPNAESALNDEAGKLILEDFAEYENMARLWTSMYARGNEFKPAEAAAPAATEAKTAAPTIVKKIANGGVDAKKRNLRRL